MATTLESADKSIIVNGVLYPKGVLRARFDNNFLTVWEEMNRLVPLINGKTYNEITNVNTSAPFASLNALKDFVEEHFFFDLVPEWQQLDW